MNTHSDTTVAPEAASKDITADNLRSCTMKQLHDFRFAVRHIAETIAGFNCQPRFIAGETNCLNAAGELLDDICDLMFRLENEAVNIAKAARPDTEDDARWRAWTILSFEADCCDDLSEFSVLAVTGARDEAAAAFAERHAARKAVAA